MMGWRYIHHDHSHTVIGGLLAAVCMAFVAGCASTPPATTVKEAPVVAPIVAAETLQYVVQGDDTWEQISERFFGNHDRAARIAMDNGFSSPQLPLPGEKVEVRVAAAELDEVRAVAAAREAYNRGVDQMQYEDGYQDAAGAFRAALMTAPHFVDARYNLGLVLLKLGDPDAAQIELTQVVVARPRDKDARYGLASAHFQRGAFGEAAQHLEQALALDDHFLRARYTYALSLERMGELEAARSAWLAYLELDTESGWALQARSHLGQLPTP